LPDFAATASEVGTNRAGEVPAIEAIGVEKRYGGVTALDGVDFAAAPGEVHALLGENGAGKSTLIKVLTGAIRPDRGVIAIAGTPVELRSRREAERHGIAAAFQELSLVPDLSVAQNIWFGIQPRSLIGTVSSARLRDRTLQLFEQLGVEGIRPGALAGELPLAQRQQVEIMRAVARAPRVLILDEATSALSASEVNWLIALVRSLAEEGVSIVFISHRMAEVRRIADRVTIFRNGKRVGVHTAATIDDEQIVEEMLGRAAGRLYPSRAEAVGDEVALSVEDLADGHRLRGVDFELHRGEILGVGGLQGQGQPELLQALFGVHRASGRIVVDGIERSISNPRDALRAGLALVPEDRQGEGLLLPKSVKDNVVLPVLRRMSHLGFLDRRAERRLLEEGTRMLHLVAEDEDQPVGSLSGGNQQKIVIAKVLLTQSRVLLFHDLVRGVDVGTKAEIFKLMRDLASEGFAILFYSTDLQELVNLSDRVLVLAQGRVVATLEGDRIREDEVLRAGLGSEEVDRPGGASPSPAPRRASRHLSRLLAGRDPARLLPFLVLAALIIVYASRQTGVLTLFELNTTAALTMALVLVAAGQTIAVLSGGFDLSVGGIVSLTTVVAATKFGESGGGLALWLPLIVVGGFVLGALNGAVIARMRMDPFIVTLATWSIWSGVATLVLKIDGGTIPSSLLTFGNGSFAGIGTAVWLIVGLLCIWAGFTRTRLGIEIKAVGSSRVAAYLSGVRVDARLVCAYGLSGMLAALAGLFLTTQTASGSPTAGNEFILTSVAAVVIGGTALGGGRATMAGTVAAAFILTLIGNVVFSFGLAAGWQVIASGALLIFAVLINGGIAALMRRLRGVQAA
jgi:ribose transport system ATP-binding protein